MMQAPASAGPHRRRRQRESSGPHLAVGDAGVHEGALSPQEQQQLTFDRLLGWISIPLNLWYAIKLAPQMSAGHVAQMVWFFTPVVLFMCLWAGRWPRSYLRHRTLLQALARLNGFFIPVVSSREAFDATIRAPVVTSVPLLGGFLTALMLSLATRTWLLVYVGVAHRIPLAPHLATHVACWAVLCLRARRNFCHTQILSSPALLAAAGKLHLLWSMVATAIVPTTVWVRPASDLASCEAALLFVWTFGLLASTVVLAPPAAAHPAPASRALALLERWLSLLQPPRKLRLRGIAAWMLRWVLVLVCMWVACVAAGGALP